MKIKISRHAKNNLKLYKISINDIKLSLSSYNSSYNEDNKLIYIKNFKNRFNNFPLKVVTKQEMSHIIIITAYPLKKKYK